MSGGRASSQNGLRCGSPQVNRVLRPAKREISPELRVLTLDQSCESPFLQCLARQLSGPRERDDNGKATGDYIIRPQQGENRRRQVKGDEASRSRFPDRSAAKRGFASVGLPLRIIAKKI